MPANLPGDRESVFFLNVLDIPPKPENIQNQNTVQLAIKSRIKMFYRPASLTGTLDNATGKLTLIASGKQFRIVNDSPFHITVANISRAKPNYCRNHRWSRHLVNSPSQQKRGETRPNLPADVCG